MDKAVFQSIVQLTRQRDLDSLDLGFVEALDRLFPIHAVTLLRAPKEDQIDALEEVLYLDSRDGEAQVVHSWANESRVLTLDEHLDACLDRLEPVSHAIDQGHRTLLPIARHGRLRGAVALESAEPLTALLDTLRGVVEIYGNYMTVLHESERDNLTGLLNRRTFDSKLHRLLESQRHSKDQCPFSQVRNERRHSDDDACSWLAVLDIDHFKRINDTYGHVYGDEILLRLAQRMREAFRKVDLLFRVGGEEFVIVLAPESETHARTSLERFREEIAEHGVPQFDAITVSIGYACLVEGDFPRRVYDLADKALYYAKENGRNQVCSYEGLVAEGRLVEEDASGSVELF